LEIHPFDCNRVSPVADEMQKLRALVDEGVLTNDEFDRKKNNYSASDS
jgi:hypothetical protein